MMTEVFFLEVDGGVVKSSEPDLGHRLSKEYTVERTDPKSSEGETENSRQKGI